MIFIVNNRNMQEVRSQKSEENLQAPGYRLRPDVLLPSNRLFFITILILLTFLSACNKNKIFKEYQALDNYSWNRFKKIVFECTIADSENNYDIYIAVRYVDGVPYRTIQSGLQIIFPDGEERYNSIELNIRNKDGSYKGSVAGDIWDCSILVLKNYPLLEKGKYSFIIHNLMDKVETPGIMEIGLIVEKSKRNRINSL